MKKNLTITVVILSFLMAFASCGSTKILTTPHDPDASILFSSDWSGGLYNKMEIVLENIETNQQYVSTKFKTKKWSSNVVYNLPPGTYKVAQVNIHLKIGSGVASFTNFSSELTEYFGTIEIEPSKKYFLGMYKYYCKEIPWYTVRNHIKFEYVEPMSIKNDNIDEGIKKALMESDWKHGEFIILRPAKYNEVFDFY